MRTRSARAVRPFHAALAAAALAAAGLTLAARPAAAQCPVGGACYFGTDETGSAAARAAGVQALAARDQFLARLAGAGTQTFEGYADGTPLPLALTFAGAGAVTLGGDGVVLTQAAGTDGDGRYPASGQRYLETYAAPGAPAAFAVSFADPAAAFGFFAADVGDFGGQLALRFTLVGGTTTTWALPYLATAAAGTRRDGSLLYAGFVGAADFTRVEFLMAGGTDDDYFALDDVTVGARTQVLPAAVVPEPSAAALVAGGLALVGAAAVRRRRA